MSTYVFMRILESAPHRYRLGIRLLTLGRLDAAYDRLTDRVHPNDRVLDLGCGAGALTLRAARKGAVVKSIDVNPEMLAITRQTMLKTDFNGAVTLSEMGVAEIDAEPAGSYDVVMSGLLFSELSSDELTFALRQVRRLLKPGGLLLAADEVVPRNLIKRLLHFLLRLPLVVITYIITQQTTHAVRNLTGQVTAAGLELISQRSNPMESFLELVAQKPSGGSE